MKFLLVHSPFLGPGVWLPLRSVLVERGHEVAAPDFRASLERGFGAHEAMVGQIKVDDCARAHVVMHSGAGALASSIWAAHKRLTSMVFLDALLPHPDASWFETLPTAIADRLRDAAVDGFLPAWPKWLPKGALEQLIPDGESRRLISAEARGVPLSYATAKAPRVVGWEQSAVCRYIQLSDAYDAQAQAAAEIGVAVTRFQGDHFSMVSAPTVVANLLIDAASA